ncbi:MAG: hypothetical protein OEY48_03840 [Gammaproteobacteria bacterium]|nr:hypothetical protein [Gammaproteobacteria bacterium]MDH5591958.1 hypothetical protein [Gammaproteobacteria bacterium]
MRYLVLILVMMIVCACSDEQTSLDGDHVWKDQTDMIDKARDVEQLLNDAAQQQHQLIEQKTQ